MLKPDLLIEMTNPTFIKRLIGVVKDIIPKQDKLNIEMSGEDYATTLKTKEGKHIYYSNALSSETEEIQGSLDWKHWKHGTDNVNNMLLEAVDIGHFAASVLIIAQGKDVDLEDDYRFITHQHADLVDDLSDCLSNYPLEGVEQDEFIRHMILLKLIPIMYYKTNLISEFIWDLKMGMQIGVDNTRYVRDVRIRAINLISIALLIYVLTTHLSASDKALTIDDALTEFKRVYDVKNVLNSFRNNNGYKDGTYIKLWNGVEDNVIAMDIANDLVLDNIDNCLYGLLEEEYNKFIKGE